MPSLEWIKITCDIDVKWQTIAIRRALKVRTVDEVVGKLYRVWRHFENQSRDGFIPRIDGQDIDAMVGKKGFADAMVSVGWLVVDAGGVRLPNYGEYMGAAARERDAAAERMRRHRNGTVTNGEHGPNAAETVAEHDRNSGVTTPEQTPNENVTVTPPKKEKEKEKEKEKKTEEEIPPPSGGAMPKPATDPKPARRPSAPTGPHAEAVAAFCGLWQARYGEKYPFDGGKDGKHISELLAKVSGDLEKLKGVYERYFADDDPFHAADSRHSVGKLRQNFQRWLVAGPLPVPRASVPITTKGEAMDAYAARLFERIVAQPPKPPDALPAADTIEVPT